MKEKLIELWEHEDPCIGCPHEGLGSEHCIAVIGDYCRAADEYIEETEEDIKFLKEIGYEM